MVPALVLGSGDGDRGGGGDEYSGFGCFVPS